ncbi:hypothetical protein [Thermacetogenium phaeum]|jgi:hypothetical protein|uniref:hypothetical protein n=1 Tax=Thermacetogenium phaeum TaxID=85874 RepID=UPI0002DE5762|nr:hypothetical protein [Thermacetogenium phaeum]
MNRHEFYRPLAERTLLNYQVQYLAHRYFGKESPVARLLVEEINRRMEERAAGATSAHHRPLRRNEG